MAINNLVHIQDDTYLFTVFLVNSDKRVFLLRPDSIKQLVIDDDYTQYYQNGYIIVDNQFDAIEQPSQVVDPNSELNTNGFIFKGAARDILRVEIMPILNNSPLQNDSSDNLNKFFRLSHEFVIYNVEEFLGESPGEKYKKLYFHDFIYEQFIEKNLQFSTSEMLSSVDVSNLTNEQRSQYTGDVLKYIIKKSQTEDGFESIFNNFERGSTKIFFSTPTNYKVEDCINYVLDRHVSDKNNNYDQCFLRQERYTQKWDLISLSELFTKAYDSSSDTGKELFLEKFIIGGYNDNTSKNKLQATIERSPKLSLHLPKFATLENFSFLPTAGLETQLTTTNKNVHSYDLNNSQFNIDVKENNFERMKSVYFENYVSKMKGDKLSKPVSNIVDNNYRINRQNVNNLFSTSFYSNIQRLSQGRNIFLSNSIFLNTSISFRVRGATYRQPGFFISIDRNSAITDNDFDNKLLGIYMIVDVKHIFSQNVYYNDLICVKPYYFKDIKSLPSIV